MSERATVVAQRRVAEVLGEGDLAVDATAGNGHDTLFLAGRVGVSGRVLAFDIQRAAIDSARRRIEAAGLAGRVGWFCESHALMAERAAAGSVAAVMFNLGYLPGGDHAVITRGEETLRALDAALGVLRPGGVLTVVGYPGHPGGDEEARAVRGWFEARGGEVFPPAREGAPFPLVLRA